MKKTAVLNLGSETLKFSISGLRGVYPTDIHPGNIPSLVEAFSRAIGKGPLAVARDSRPTGPAIEQLVLGTLAALGRDVHHLGLVPTPTIKAYVNRHSLAGGIMISASHNPVNYNAFKFIQKKGAFFDAAYNKKFLQNLETNENWGTYKKQGKILKAQKVAIDEHVQEVLNAISLPLLKKIRIGLDCVGGAGSLAAVDFLESTGASVFSIFSKETPFFPRPPEPVPKALKKLGELVIEKKCHIGFALDPDADRLAIVGPDGRAIGEELTVPLALLSALGSRKGDVVVNLSSSHLNRWAAEKFSRKLFRSKVGEANVVSMMQQKKAAFAGEGNGGVIDPEISSVGRDSLAGMGWVMKLLSKESNLYEHTKEFPQLVIIKKTLKANTSLLPKIFSQLKEQFSDFIFDESDGLHLSRANGFPWVHLRSSNTEPIIRIIAEAESKREVNHLVSKIERFFEL